MTYGSPQWSYTLYHAKPTLVVDKAIMIVDEYTNSYSIKPPLHKSMKFKMLKSFYAVARQSIYKVISEK